MPHRILYRSDLPGCGDVRGTWTTDTPREEIGAGFSIDDTVSGWGDESAALHTRLPDVAGGQGKWICTLDAAAGASYRLTARFKTKIPLQAV